MSGGTYPDGQVSNAARAAAGALFGGASGAAAWGLAALSSAAGIRSEWIALTGPGAVFGLAASLVVWRLGHARAWQAVLFAILSAMAWPIGVAVATEVYLSPGVVPESDEVVQDLFVGLAGGAVWAALQALAAATFPFARRMRVLAGLLVMGTAIPGVVVAALFERGLAGDLLFLVLWPAWYAAIAAIAAAALPRRMGPVG